MNVFVKKIWSLNPDKYKFMRVETALEHYARYIKSCVDSGHNTWRTFDNWLRFEI